MPVLREMPTRGCGPVIPAPCHGGAGDFPLSVTLMSGQEEEMREQPGSVAVNHAGLWIPRQQFESAPGYRTFFPCA